MFLKLLWLSSSRVFSTLELQSQDGMQRLAYSLGIVPEIYPDIVYVDIDDNSISSLNFSPNDPALYANIISTLQQAGVAAQLIDMFFLNNEKENVLNTAISQSNAVFLPVIFTPGIPEPTDKLPSSAKWLVKNPPDLFPPGNPTMGLTPLLFEAKGTGHINCWPDEDGVYRHIPLFFSLNNTLVPTISLQLAAQYLNISSHSISFTDTSVVLANARFPDKRVADIHIPFNEKGMSRIVFTGPWPRMFAHYSAATILEKGATLEGRAELLDEMENSLVIVSDVTTGGRDFGPVPFSSYSPLSEIHANFLNSIVTQSFSREANIHIILVQDGIIFFLLVLAALLSRGYTLMITTMCTAFLFLVINFISIAYFHFFLPVISPICFIVLGATSILLIQFVAVQKEKTAMQARLAPYFAPVVMDKILQSPEMLTTVTKKKLTIVFSDIVAFTEWSSKNEAQDIHDTLSRYFSEMSGVIFSFEGTIDKFMGDGMLAFFGDPSPQQDHAVRAVEAALSMQQKAKELRDEWAVTGGMKLSIRIGIHSGEVVVGNMGSSERMDYTVIGSDVNLAQRLESNCSPDRILISREVHDQLDGLFITSASGTIEVKGFPEPIEVFYVDRIKADRSTVSG